MTTRDCTGVGDLLAGHRHRAKHSSFSSLSPPGGRRSELREAHLAATVTWASRNFAAILNGRPPLPRETQGYDAVTFARSSDLFTSFLEHAVAREC